MIPDLMCTIAYRFPFSSALIVAGGILCIFGMLATVILFWRMAKRDGYIIEDARADFMRDHVGYGKRRNPTTREK